MKTKQKGDLAVAKAIASFTERGYEVLLPIGDKKPYDMVVETEEGELKKVQCKYTSHKSKYDVYKVPLKVMGGNRTSGNTSKKYDKKDFDILYVLTSDGQEYIIPFCEVSATGQLSLGKDVEQWRFSVLK